MMKWITNLNLLQAGEIEDVCTVHDEDVTYAFVIYKYFVSVNYAISGLFKDVELFGMPVYMKKAVACSTPFSHITR